MPLNRYRGNREKGILEKYYFNLNFDFHILKLSEFINF